MKIEEIIGKAIEARIIEELTPLVKANKKAEYDLNHYQFGTKDIDPIYLNSLWSTYRETQSVLYESQKFAEKILGKRISIYTTGDIEIGK